ncbi:serine/threonine-protein kinase pakB [Drosophila navojoa]|uniref:serine/threonine-protein kinase pakB n=1 Tax=Drosophila navojoa TaxID=7232 RepID=UPI0011BFB6BC|nr:serine/threonine-protein kinase pakB [Drosophila navojoa]
MKFAITMSALGLLLLVGAQGTTIISIKYPPQSADAKSLDRTQPAKRDLSLSYAATNIDSREGTRVKTITVIKNVGGLGESSAASNKQQKLAINPELHKNEEWANAFRDNFESYGGLPEVPDIDDLFDFVNKKKVTQPTEKEIKRDLKPTEGTTKATPPPSPPPPPSTTKATSEHAEDADDSDEATVEKIKGDAELLPHIKQANILRLQALDQQPDQRQRTRESLINVNYSTPMHSVSQFFENYVQVLPNGYDYTKPQQPQQPCALPSPPNSIQVTTPSGRSYNIPQSNSSGTNGGANHPYLAPSLAKRTQIQPAAPAQPQPQPQSQQPPNFSTVNSLVPPIGPKPQGTNYPVNVPQQQQPQAPTQGVGAVGASTSQRPYVAPSLRNNGLGINRGPSTPQPPAVPSYNTGNVNGGYPTNSYGANRPNTFRSRGLKY